jgi:sulfite exporter TauE/SafE
VIDLGFLLPVLLAGLLGSIHCVAMCGPFAAAAGRRGPAASALYSAGRLTSYGSLGALAGLLGAGLHASLAGLTFATTALALAAGLVLAALGVRALLPPKSGRVRGLGPLGWLYARLVPLAQACLRAQGNDAAYLLGVVNGLLPCPVTTPLLLAAFAYGSPVVGSTLLLAAGLGTGPAMLAAGQAGGVAMRWLGRWRSGRGWNILLQRAPGLALLALGLLTALRPFLLHPAATHHLH